MKFTNLCYVLDGEKVLLIEKKRGLGAGKVNGPGGHMEEGESPEGAVIREVEEEVGIRIKPKFHGILEFNNNGALAQLCFIFIANGYDGKIIETEEAKPFWAHKDKMPYHRMWDDDKFWLPYVLQGKQVFGRFHFEDWKSVKQEVHLMTKI